MARRRFSRAPTVGTGSRASDRNVRGELPVEVQRFKATYVLERRVLQRFREGADAPPYTPSPTLNGRSRWDTAEERTSSVSAWEKAYRKLERSPYPVDPCRAVRILFYILRGSSIAIPTVAQLATPNMLELVREYIQDKGWSIREQFVLESKRAESAIRINQRGAGHALGLSVYYALVDSRLGLSPLFRYCLAMETAKKLKLSGYDGEDCNRLEKVAKQSELLAAMDYTLFPDDYDVVWGSVIPSNFRVVACSLLDEALEAAIE